MKRIFRLIMLVVFYTPSLALASHGSVSLNHIEGDFIFNCEFKSGANTQSKNYITFKASNFETVSNSKKVCHKEYGGAGSPCKSGYVLFTNGKLTENAPPVGKVADYKCEKTSLDVLEFLSKSQ